MGKNIKNELIKIFILVDTGIMAVFSLCAFFFNWIFGLVCLVITAGLFAYHRFLSRKRIDYLVDRFKENVIEERNDLMDSFASSSPLALCIIGRDLKVKWCNEYFARKLAGNSELVPGKESIRPLIDNTVDNVKVRLADKVYRVTSTSPSKDDPSIKLLFWQDITSETETEQKYKDSLMCTAIINIDNLDEILRDTPIEERSLLAAGFEEKIYAWAKILEASAEKTYNERYILTFKNRMLVHQKSLGFEILNEVRGIETKADFPASLSIGIGCGECTMLEQRENASDALELALGRGGDQVVIRNEHGEIEYYGGLLPSVEKKNKGKSRVYAHVLSGLMQDADKVYIMGHTRPDMDSLGTAIGVYAFANNIGKTACIVLENPGDGIEEILKQAKNQKTEDGEPKYSFISHSYAEETITEKTLLVIVDHNRKILSEDPDLIDRANKIVMIDHHRKTADSIDRIVLDCSQTFLSSASEVMAEMLLYSGERGEITHFEADALLAGIMLDTQNLTTNTGVRTYDAASWLKRQGADVKNVKSFFKVDLEFYQKKLNVLANAEILSNGIAVAYTKENDPAMGIIVSQAADELLNMKGVDAAIAAGMNGEITMVSARSNGKYNMQTLMETLGGGGHQKAAAVQLEQGPEESISAVVQAMRLEGIL